MLEMFAFFAATFLTQILSAFLTKWLNILVPQPGLPLTPITIYFNSTEIFCLLSAIFLIGIWVYDLRRSSLMHTNLKFVCFLISFHILTASILQILLIIDKFITFIPVSIKPFIAVIHGCARMHFTLDPPTAALERGLATLKVSNYEKMTSKKQWIALMFAKEIIGIITFYVLTYTKIGMIAFGIFWIFLLNFTVIIGIILYRVNLRSYKTRIGMLHLTTRYQTVENIRCLKPVLIYSFLAVIQNIMAFILAIFLIFHIFAGDFGGGSAFESVINLIVSIFSILYPSSFLIYSSRVRKYIRNKLKFYRKSSVSSKSAVPVLSVMGKVLITKNEQNIYFNQLKTAWK